MSWIQQLYETYNNCQTTIGYSGEKGVRPLLPICHITTQAHIDIVIDRDGRFRRANLVNDKDDAVTIIPCTEGSASRSGKKPENHPLCDKLQYISGDFSVYGGIVTVGFINDPEEPYRKFVESLSGWSNSKFTHPKIEAILKYIQQKTVIRDLIDFKILLVGTDGKLISKEKIEREKNTTDIFSVINPQYDAFVRWIVEIPDIQEARVWKDKSLWNSWINYYLSTKENDSLCYVTGEEKILTTNHPKYIRKQGDGAKLISSNDTSGFTYRGRFTTDQQACSVSLEASQKSHYALSWLISRQGYRNGNLAIVAWATSGVMVPQPTEDIFSMLGMEELKAESPETAYTAQELAVKLKMKIAGYGKELGSTSKVVVMGLDSATKGRMAIIYYRELDSSDFLERINEWHQSCAWLHEYRSVTVQKSENTRFERRYVPFVGAPAPNDIAEAAYGTNKKGKFFVDERLRKVTIERILPCIVEGQQIPRDIVESAVRKATNRIALEEWQWNKSLSIACALFRKSNGKESYDMALDLERNTRDYLYGRLLALADSLEEWALNEAHEKRETNAARLMQRFAEHPCSTWRTIELALTPYKARLGSKSKSRLKMIDEVIASFKPEDFLNDRRLSGEFLLGYHCQREFLRHGQSKSEHSDYED